MADNEFGYTAWGRDWVRLAEPLRQTKPEPLLPRARSIARNHGVRTEIGERTVRAHLHRGGQASVAHIEVAPLDRARVTAIGRIIPDPSVLTDEMHRALLDAGHSPAPTLVSTDCSCSARTDRCVHVLAVLYAIAGQVDENPRLALELQGYFDATVNTDTPTAEARWTSLHTLDPAEFFTAAR
ncbi:SWIM zinc finger family protein [Nocardia sp. AG03]|uniref:SWIM zinc finger family protein n=1 Tax=Nocardia sp. AG03 TaxID=3025312 RepID=UPI0024185290|nr:SWIM zinc finger family protein [Nocardia sp. AG03]